MKKSILAVGAAAVVGGLGFASAAHAVAIFGAVPGQTTANRVLQSAGAIGHMRSIAQPTWDGLVRVHGADHPVALGVATTMCLGAAAAADVGLCILTFAWDTFIRSEGTFGSDHPNTVNARRSAEALDAHLALKAN